MANRKKSISYWKRYDQKYCLLATNVIFTACQHLTQVPKIITLSIICSLRLVDEYIACELKYNKEASRGARTLITIMLIQCKIMRYIKITKHGVTIIASIGTLQGSLTLCHASEYRYISLNTRTKRIN